MVGLTVAASCYSSSESWITNLNVSCTAIWCSESPLCLVNYTHGAKSKHKSRKTQALIYETLTHCEGMQTAGMNAKPLPTPNNTP